MYDVIIVGSGFAGSVVACELGKKGKKILLLEKRPEVGGNMYEMVDGNGIRVHKYGPHIFHTNFVEAYNYLANHCELFFYEHTVVGSIDGRLVPIPFNFKSIELIFEKTEAEKIKSKLKGFFPNEIKVSILDLINHKDKTIKKFGDYVYEKVFANYTAKQWNIDIKDIDKSVINRVPVVLGYDNRYFQDKYQFMPKNGYNEIFTSLLDSPNIDIVLSCDSKDRIQISKGKILLDGNLYNGKLVYTGQIDELFHNKFGRLPYRSLLFKFKNYKMNYFQPNSVVNYPNDHKFTRITEFKYLTNQQSKSTTILEEYPQEYDGKNVPYYAISNDENNNLYDKYRKEAEKIKGLYLCGRLAEYKYYNMDQVIIRALEIVKEIK